MSKYMTKNKIRNTLKIRKYDKNEIQITIRNTTNNLNNTQHKQKYYEPIFKYETKITTRLN